ncbi:ferredoxin [Candidatus Omnitrophota bacterium]
MKALVSDELCVGCGLCADVCPDVFAMEESKAKVKNDSVPESCSDCSKRAKEDCPVEAITIEE